MAKRTLKLAQVNAMLKDDPEALMDIIARGELQYILEDDRAPIYQLPDGSFALARMT